MNFESLAKHKLEALADQLEDQLEESVADIHLQQGVLVVELLDGRQFVISKHSPMEQIWLSSPLSGAVHFKWHGERWVSTRNAVQFFDEMLSQELSALTGRIVRI